MIKLSLDLDTRLSKVVFGFVGSSAAAATVCYLSSRNENQSNVKDHFSMTTNISKNKKSLIRINGLISSDF